MNKNVLLNSDLAKKLYESVAVSLPIVDYHNHLSLNDIISNKRYTNVYDVWIKPDPYKHRAMRISGIPEKYITGDASDIDKFKAWCCNFPNLIGNPLYIWSKMELKTVFGIEETPSKDNWKDIYDKANAFLSANEVTPEYFIKLFNVDSLCPCASLNDDVTPFIKNDKVSPSLRGDNIVAPTVDFIKSLGTVSDIKINTIHDYKDAVAKRLDDFYGCGCRFSDHALDNGFKYYADDDDNGRRFSDILNGEKLNKEDGERFTSFMLVFLFEEYAKRKMTLQLHVGAERWTSDRLRRLAGGAGGFAGIGNSVDVKSLTVLLNDAEKTEGGLPKTIIYTLNPSDNAVISILSGSYSKDDVSGLITQGPAWWWCDHKYCIDDVLESVANFSLLSEFVGMTTDSRSFLSLVRHDYFRRVLCSFIADKVNKGEYPDDLNQLKTLICRLCYDNANKISR